VGESEAFIDNGGAPAALGSECIFCDATMDSAQAEPTPARAQALWPLPLIAGALPAIAVPIAWSISVDQQLIPACNPFFEGCASISRAARYGLANYLFRALVLPAAVLQALTWWLAADWLLRLNTIGKKRAWIIVATGIVAAIFLVLYASFLGTEGNVYRWARRYGVVFYFGFTCIGMLLVAGATRAHAWRVARWAPTTLFSLCAALPLLGLINAFAPLYLPRETARDVVQNITEWWAGLVFTVFFVVVARLWAVSRFSARLQVSSFSS
jgi:hypothetical protein